MILAALLRAALDDAHWPAASALIDEACGIKGNLLTTAAGDSRANISISRFAFHLRGEQRPDLERLYLENFYRTDERIPRVRALQDFELAHTEQLYTDNEKRTSRAYREVSALSHTGNALHVQMRAEADTRIVWVLADPVDGDWSAERIRTLRGILPHLRACMVSRQALVDANLLSRSLTDMLGSANCGVIQLGPRGRIVAANGRADDFLSKRDGVTSVRGALAATIPEEDEALQRVLARALPRFGGGGMRGTTTVSRRLRPRRLVLHVTPLPHTPSGSRGGGVAALALLVDPWVRAPADPGLVAEVFQLTPSEAQVASLIAQGYSLEEIAGRTGKRHATVRWHLKNVYNKQVAPNRAELTRLVQSLSPAARLRDPDHPSK